MQAGRLLGMMVATRPTNIFEKHFNLRAPIDHAVDKLIPPHFADESKGCFRGPRLSDRMRR